MGEIRSGDRTLSTADLFARAAKAATGFAELGVSSGDTVALFLRNDFAFYEASLAANLLGAYPVPVNWHYTVDEANYLFEDSGAKVIVIHADLIEGIRAALPVGVVVLVVSTPPEIREAYGLAASQCKIPEDMPEWQSWRDAYAPLESQGAPNPGTMVYTSGTTGRPKGVRRAQPTLAQAEQWMNLAARGCGFTAYRDNPQEMVIAITGPMYHAAPNTYGLTAARLGATVIIQPRFDPEDLLRMIEANRITHMHQVPIMFVRLLKLPERVRRKYDLSSLRWILHGAAPCAESVKRQMIEWWGPIVNEYYGSTETGIMVTLSSSQDWLAHPGTVGAPLPGAIVRVVDEEGRDCRAGESGEICCRWPTLANFTYHRDEEKRRRAQRGELFSMGDIGYFDEAGYLYICDREIDMIISGGVNIYPAEIEAVLLRMPGIADCAVFGIPDDEFGESVCAIIQAQEGARIGEAQVRAFLAGKAAGFKIPKRIQFSDQLPREDSGKIFKRKLREPYWEGVSRRI